MAILLNGTLLKTAIAPMPVYTYGSTTRLTLSYADNTNPLNISLQLISLELSNDRISTSGLIKSSGSLVLTSTPLGGSLNLIGNGTESLDVRLNPRRWKRGARLFVEVDIDGEWLPFCRGALRILQQPTPPIYTGESIQVDIGCELAYLDSGELPTDLRTIQNDLTQSFPPSIGTDGITGNIPRTNAINKLGELVGAPALIDEIPGTLLRLPSVDGSVIEQMGLIALAKGYHLYTDSLRRLRAVKLDPTRNADLTYNVATQTLEYRALQGEPSPPDKVEVTASKSVFKLSVRRGGDRSVQPPSGDDPPAREAISSSGGDDSATVTSEKNKGALFPNAFPNDLTLVVASQSETQDTFTTIDGTEVLTGREVVTRAPRGLVLPNVYNADTALMRARKEVWEWEVEDGQVVTETHVIYEPAQLVLPEESWADEDKESLVVSRQELRAWEPYKEGYALTESFTDVKTGESDAWVSYEANTTPPAPTIKASNEPEIEPVTASAEYESEEAEPQITRITARIQVDSDDDLQAIANIEGVLEHGRSQPAQWVVPLPSLFQTFYEPGLALQFTEPSGYVGRYLADGESFILTRDSTLYGAEGLFLGTVTSESSVEILTPPFTAIPRSIAVGDWSVSSISSGTFQGESIAVSDWSVESIGRAPINGESIALGNWSVSSVGTDGSSSPVLGTSIVDADWSVQSSFTLDIQGQSTAIADWSVESIGTSPLPSGNSIATGDWSVESDYTEPAPKSIATGDWSVASDSTILGESIAVGDWSVVSIPSASQSLWMTQYETNLGVNLADVSQTDRDAMEAEIQVWIANGWISSDPAAHDSSYPITEFYPFAGDTLTTALVKLIYLPGHSPTLVNNGFTSGDYSRTAGLTGDTISYLQSGVTPSVDFADNTQGSLSAYVIDDAFGAGTYLGALTNNPRIGLSRFSGSVFAEFYSSSNAERVFAAFTPSRLLLGSRVSSTDLRLFNDGTEVALQTGANTQPLSTSEIFIFRSNSSIPYEIDASLGCAHIGSKGIPTADVTAFTASVQNIMGAFGRTPPVNGESTSVGDWTVVSIAPSTQSLWMDQYETNLGGNLSDVSISDRTALEAWIQTAISNGWIAATPATHDNTYPISEFYPFAGDTLTTALVKLVYLSGKSATLSNNGFVSGDYNRTTGITGDGTSYLQTGLTPSTDWIDASSVSLAAYIRTNAVTGLWNEIGARDFSGASRRLELYISASLNDMYTALGANTTATNSSILLADRLGVAVGTRVSTTDARLYTQGVERAQQTLSIGTGTLPNAEAVIFGYNDSGSVSRVSSSSLGFAMLGGRAIPLADVAAFTTAGDTLMTAFGRNV